MKAQIHPTYYTDTIVTCSCGNTFTTGSTVKEIRVELCHKCHPLYTGEKRFVDTLGQVGKFQEKQKKATEYKKTLLQKTQKKEEKKQAGMKTLKDLLLEM